MWNLRTLARLRRILGACAAGRQDRGATGTALLTCIVELDPAQRGA